MELSDANTRDPVLTAGSTWPVIAAVVAAILIPLGILSVAAGVLMFGASDAPGLTIAACGFVVGLASVAARYRKGGQSRQVRMAWLAAMVLPVVAVVVKFLAGTTGNAELGFALAMTILSALLVFTSARFVSRVISAAAVALVGFAAITNAADLASGPTGGGLTDAIPAALALLLTGLQLLLVTVAFVRAILLGRGGAELSVRSVEQAHQHDCQQVD